MKFRLGRQLYAFLMLSLFFGLEPRVAQASTLECEYLPSLFQNYLAYHYSERQLNDDIQARTIDQFVKGLDPSKTMLLQSDIDKLNKDLPSVFKTMRAGECGQFEDVRKILNTRAAESEAYVKSYLAKPFKLDTSIELVLDPEKRGYPATLEEKQQILRKMIHFQMSNLMIADVKPAKASEQLIKRYELGTKRLSERDGEDMLVAYAEAFARGLDPHTGFLSRDRLQDFQIQMRLSLEGIGASLTSEYGFTIVQAIIPGGGAERSNRLHPGDKILAVAQEKEAPVSVIDMDLSEVVKMIRGKKGTKVTLSILREGDTTETFDVTIVRDKIDIKDQAASITYEERTVGEKKLTIGILELPSFYGGGQEGRSSYDDMKELLEEANAKGVDGIVLDLSRNGGGLLDHAVKISGLFIRKGAVVATRDTRGKVQVLADTDDSIVYGGPLVVLISRVSASASEILAGTLQDYGRALIVGGDHTFGKGTVQSVVDLPRELGAMTVTMGMFFLPGGDSTQHGGVTSDIHFPTPFGGEDIGEKKLDYSLPPQSIRAFLSKEANAKKPAEQWTPIEKGSIAKLTESSQARVAANPKFAEMRKDREENRRNNRGPVKLSELHTKAMEGKKKDKDADASKGKAPRPDPREELKALVKPMIDESVSILADLVALQNGGLTAKTKAAVSSGSPSAVMP